MFVNCISYCDVFIFGNVNKWRTCIKYDVARVFSESKLLIANRCLIDNNLPMIIWIDFHPKYSIETFRRVFLIFLKRLLNDRIIITTKMNFRLTWSICKVHSKHGLLYDPINFHFIYKKVHGLSCLANSVIWIWTKPE